MDYERAKSLLRQAGQSHLLDYYGELDEKQRNILLKDIEKTDFTVLENIGLKTRDFGRRIKPRSGGNV